MARAAFIYSKGENEEFELYRRKIAERVGKVLSRRSE